MTSLTMYSPEDKVQRKSVKLLDMSRNYWLRRGIKDWGIVTDAAEE